MATDLPDDPEDLKRQERRFVWQLIGFVALIGVAGIVFCVVHGPKLERERNAPGHQLVKTFQEFELNRARALAIRDKLEQLVNASRQTDRQFDELFQKVAEREARRERMDDLVVEFDKLQRQSKDDTQRMEQLAAEIEAFAASEQLGGQAAELLETYRRLEESRKTNRATFERTRDLLARLATLQQQR